MLYMKVLLLACLLCLGTSLIKIMNQPYVKIRSHSLVIVKSSSSSNSGATNDIRMGTKLIEPNAEDMKVVAQILANITDHLYEQPGLAMKVVSNNMGWLYSRNVPLLTQLLLKEYPMLREDKMMLEAFMFLMDFLEAVTTETTAMLQKNQQSLKMVLEAAKVSESILDQYIQVNNKNLTSPEFLLYLDTEIEAQDVNSLMQSLLVTIKLRLLDELGRGKGYDVMMLPKLAAESDPGILREKTLAHINGYPAEGCELFHMTLKMLRSEMLKRYGDVDPMLTRNLGEIEKIVVQFSSQLTTSPPPS